MKKITFLFFISLIANLQAQEEFDIFLGGGFHGEKVTLIGKYYLDDKKKADTIIYEAEINSDFITGFAEAYKAKYNPKSKYELEVRFDELVFLYSTDKISRKSQIRIQKHQTIQFSFLYKGGFRFY